MEEKIQERHNALSNPMSTPNPTLAEWAMTLEDLEQLKHTDEYALSGFVIDAVYAYAYALKNLLNTHCPNATGINLFHSNIYSFIDLLLSVNWSIIHQECMCVHRHGA